MQLREIHVISFGILANVHIRGLRSGLNVLHGPNEFGKTSLLEFSRRVLFGFPSRTTKANQYLLPSMEKNSGQLLCELRDGRTLSVARTTGKSGGPLTVTTVDGTTLSEPDFATAMGHVSPDLYQNVFSVGLQELYDIDVVNLDEVKDRIYGAGLGGVSIPGLKEHFEERASALYKKGGHKQRLKELADDITKRTKDIEDERNRLAKYDDKKSERDHLTDAVEELEASLRTMQADLRHLENQQRLYPTFVDMQRTERQLVEMGEVPEIPDEALVELQNRLGAMKNLDERLEETNEQIRLKRAAIERISYDAALIQHEQDIRSLSQSIASYRSTRDELPIVLQQLQEAQQLVEQKLAVLGEGWTEERVRDFVLTAEQKDSLRHQESELRNCEHRLDNARRKLEVHRDNVRAAGIKQGTPRSIRLAGLAILALGGVNCVLAALSGDTLVAAISGSVGLIGLLVALAPGSASGRMRDPAGAQYEAEIHAAEERLEMARSEWSAVLKHLGLSPSLSPEAKDETLQLVEDVSDDLHRMDKAKERISHLQETLSSLDGRCSTVTRDLREPLPGDDTAAHIEALDARLTAARAERVKEESLSEEMRQRGEELKGLQQRRENEHSGLSAFLAAHDAPSTEKLREKYQRFSSARELRDSRDANLRTIETTVGADEARDIFIQALGETTPEEIADSLAQMKERITLAEAELKATNTRITELGSELKTLVSADDLVSREAEVETLKQQARDTHRQWLTARIALWGIGAAVSRYEEERQPDVIRAAQEAFSNMTGGRYEKLVKPLDSNDLHVRDRNGHDRTVGQLSRGTREQLYLAMRMGLIEQYEQQAEPMPVIMDDILVNFDDERGPLAVQALANFSKDRQVIVMTCHKNTLELYRRVGAIELAIERDSSTMV